MSKRLIASLLLIGAASTAHAQGVPVNDSGLTARDLIETGHQPMFIGGRFMDADSGETSRVEDPATGAPVITVPSADQVDVDPVVAAGELRLALGELLDVVGRGGLLDLGIDGFRKVTASILVEVEKMVAFIKSCPDLELMAEPDSTLISFRCVNFSTYFLTDAMESRGLFL